MRSRIITIVCCLLLWGCSPTYKTLMIPSNPGKVRSGYVMYEARTSIFANACWVIYYDAKGVKRGEEPCQTSTIATAAATAVTAGAAVVSVPLTASVLK